MLDWMKHKLDSRLLGEISINSGMQMTPHLRQKAKRRERLKEKEEKLKSLLMKVEETLKSRFSLKLFFKKMRDFPDSPMVKTPCSHCRGPGLDPWLGN